MGKQASKQHQKYYRHLRNYGQTLEQTKYAKGGAEVATRGFVAALQGSQPSKLEEWQRKESSLEVLHRSKQRLESAKAEHVAKPLVDMHFQRHADSMLVLDSFLKTCTDAASSSAYIAASVFMLQNSWECLKYACKTGASGTRAGSAHVSPDESHLETLDAAAAQTLSYVKAIWATVQNLLNSGHLHAHPGDPDVTQAIQLCLKAAEDLGFHGTSARLGYCLAMHDTIANLDPVAAMVGHMMRRVRDRAGADLPPDIPGQGMLSTGMTEACFQLRHLGHLLPRELPRTADPRATSFNPDMWQRQVLDAVDDRASCVVCARGSYLQRWEGGGGVPNKGAGKPNERSGIDTKCTRCLRVCTQSCCSKTCDFNTYQAYEHTIVADA